MRRVFAKKNDPKNPSSEIRQKLVENDTFTATTEMKNTNMQNKSANTSRNSTPRDDQNSAQLNPIRNSLPRPAGISNNGGDGRKAAVPPSLLPPSQDLRQIINPADYLTTLDQHHSYFLPEEGYGWDFCIIVPNPAYYKTKHEEEDHHHQLRDEKSSTPSSSKKVTTIMNSLKIQFDDIIERLYLAGLQTYCFQSGDEDEIFIKIRAPLHRLKDHATEIGFDVLYDPTYLKKYIDRQSAPIATDPELTSLSPYQFIYGPYDKEKPELFLNAKKLTHPFSSVIRIKLLMDIITSDEEHCCALNLRKLIHDGPDDENSSVIAFFPLHDEIICEELNRIWLNWNIKPWEQPIDDVKDYLGEKVALYFEFIGHYTSWLRALTLAGLVVTIDMIIETIYYNSIDHALLKGYSIPFFCIFVSFWSQLMIEYWKRRESTKAMEWGMSDFEQTQAQRPEFKGLPIHSVVDGKLVKYFDTRSRQRKLLYSYFIIGCMMLLVLTCVSGIFGLQYYINSDVNDDSNKTTGNTAVSVFSAIQIVVLNAIYSDLAINLNDNENHRTDTEYDDALIGKLFAFSFINSYASLFFIAFIKSNLGEACQGPCMAELAYQLTILIATKITMEKITNYVTLKVSHMIKEHNEAVQYSQALKEHRKVFEPSKIEKEKDLEEYDPSLGVLTDYAQVFLQFGFVTLFVSACPVAPLLAYFGNQVEIRGDGSKLLFDMRRTIPTGAQDIGTWLVILQMTAVIAVVTNAGIVCFTMDLLQFSSWGHVWAFIGFQYFIFISMAIFSYVVDDVPEYVGIQLQRQEYLRERVNMTEEERAKDGKLEDGRPKHTNIPQHLFKVDEFDEENPTKEIKYQPSSCIIC